MIFFNIENGRKRQTHISAAADCWTSTLDVVSGILMNS